MVRFVRFNSDSHYGEYKHGQVGELQGFVRGGDDVPCAVVLVDDKFVVAPINHLARYTEKIM